MMEYDDKAARATECSYLAPAIVNQRLRTLDMLTLRAGARRGLRPRAVGVRYGVRGRCGWASSGIDKSETMLRLARQRCAHLSQAGLSQGEAQKLAAYDQSFDALACTQVLLYLDDVGQVLAEMRRVLKPRGRIALVETDWRSVVLHSNEQAVTRNITQAWDQAVPSPNLPTQLGSLLRTHHFTAVRVEAIPVLETRYAPDSFSAGMAKSIAASAQERGVIGEAQTRAWLGDLERLEREGSYFFCVSRFLFSAVKGLRIAAFRRETASARGRTPLWPNPCTKMLC